MCGFVVIVGRNGRKIRPEVVERMTQSLAHRGPNDSGIWIDHSVALGFRRLSIIDTSVRGHQPMISSDGANVVAFNGEIYNYVELRHELKSLGRHFRSASDTEVLLAAWQQWGDACVERFEGMYAFVIWDTKTNEFFGARDPFGIKPLYVHKGNDVVLLASEIKAIQASGIVETRVNWPVIARYLVDGELGGDPITCFEGIEEISPGHTFRVGPNTPLRLKKYFEIPTELDAADRIPETVGAMLERAVQMQMRADVPLGVCLSGGLDSTAIICEMARNRFAFNSDHPLRAFNYNAPEFDETPYIDATLGQTGATLVQWQGAPQQLWDNFPKLLHFHDEPVHSMNALIGFELMGLARRNDTIVILNGQGADETLGGYSSHFPAYWTSLVMSGRPDRAWGEIRQFAKAFGFNAQQIAAQVSRRLALRTARELPGYEKMARAVRHRALQDHAWFESDLALQAPNQRVRGELGLDAEQRRSLVSASLPLYLRIEDRNSMAHGVEVRVPFLDHKLASYALTMPLEWRIRGPWNKYALREGTRGRIPEMVRQRLDKMGFPTPESRWFANQLYESVRSVFDTPAARNRGLFRVDKILKMLDQSRGGTVTDHLPIFRAANVEIWLQMLAQRESEASAAAKRPHASQDDRASRNAFSNVGC